MCAMFCGWLCYLFMPLSRARIHTHTTIHFKVMSICRLLILSKGQVSWTFSTSLSPSPLYTHEGHGCMVVSERDTYPQSQPCSVAFVKGAHWPLRLFSSPGNNAATFSWVNSTSLSYWMFFVVWLLLLCLHGCMFDVMFFALCTLLYIFCGHKNFSSISSSSSFVIFFSSAFRKIVFYFSGLR